MPPPTAPPEPQFYTTTEVAAMLNIGRSTVYDKANRGDIPGLVRFAGYVRIDRETFDAWLKDVRAEAR